MRPGGQETFMREANRVRGELIEGIKWGKRVEITMNLQAAALWLGIEVSTLEKLAKKDKELRISGGGNKLVVELAPGERQKRQIYLALYAVAGGSLSGSADEILAMSGLSEEIVKEIPRLAKLIAVLQEGNYLPGEDMRILHIYLAAYYEGLRSKSNLPHWTLALQSQAV